MQRAVRYKSGKIGALSWNKLVRGGGELENRGGKAKWRSGYEAMEEKLVTDKANFSMAKR